MSKRSNEEQFSFLVTKGAEHLKQFLTDEIPTTGRIQPFRMRFGIPGTSNIGLFIVESAENGSSDERYLRIGVFRDGTDRLTSNYMAKGTNDALIEYLSRDNLAAELQENFHQLSEKTDDHWD